MRGPQSCGMRSATACAALAFALALVFMVVCAARAASYHTPEARMLMQIKELAPDFGVKLERLVFQDGPGSPSAAKAVRRVHEWLTGNKYPRIREFLQALSDDDVRAFYELFMTDASVGSAPNLPLYEELGDIGQFTPLALPFDGEWYVQAGNDTPPHHAPGTPHRYAYDFVASPVDAEVGTPFSAVNSDYATFHKSILSPAAGAIESVEHSHPDHAPGSPEPEENTNIITIDHGDREHSRILFVAQQSAVIAPGGRVDALQPVALVGNNGPAQFPTLHYQLDVAGKGGDTPVQARFAVFFARDNQIENHRLVISGIPATDQYVVNVDGYLDMY